MLNLSLFGSILGGFGVDLETFSHMGRIAKIVKNLSFFVVFRYSGGLGWLVEASWALFRAMLAPRSHFGAHLGGMLRHVGAKMAAKSAQMSQHRRKSAPRLAR